MSKIGFLTDSCSDIPQELADKYGIEVVGFPINLDGVEYMERKDFTNDQFYQMMRDAQGVPTTAAITQLQVVGKQLDIPVFEMGQANPVRIAEEAIKYARDHGHDMVFLDTAGRLHVDEALMNELKNIKAKVHPNEILLVVDAMTGQDAVNAATAFDQALGIDGVMLTKLDASSWLMGSTKFSLNA